MSENWKIISGNIQGDISYQLKKSVVTSSYVDLEITVYGERWSEVDIAIDYRLTSRDAWN